MNAITIYVGQKIIPFDEIAQNLLGGAARLSGSFGPSLLAIGTVAVAWLFSVPPVSKPHFPPRVTSEEQ